MAAGKHDVISFLSAGMTVPQKISITCTIMTNKNLCSVEVLFLLFVLTWNENNSALANQGEYTCVP